MNILERLKNGVLVFDGAMGTMLQQRGLKPGAMPELLNLEAPDVVTSVHRDYVLAGSDVVTANTFQAHELKLIGEHSVEEIVEAGVRCAKKSGARFVAMDAGPLGQLLEPMGPLRFERAYEIYRRQMIAGERAGADLIAIETLFDPYEAKIAVLAAKENTSLPVFCTMTFQEGGHTFLGCDALTATLILQGLGVDALGVNCSLGPELLIPVVDVMLKYSRVPVIVQANAGLPVTRDGRTFYDTTPEEYAGHVLEMVRRGVRVVGGCCGTSPAYIREIKKRLDGVEPPETVPAPIIACSSGRRATVFADAEDALAECGSPSGRDEMREAFLEDGIDGLVDEAMEYAGEARILDVNVSMPGTDDAAAFTVAVRGLQGVAGAPLQISGADPEAAEAAMRIYNGKPIVNVSGASSDIVAKILPAAKKYGALVAGISREAAEGCSIPAGDLIMEK